MVISPKKKKTNRDSYDLIGPKPKQNPLIIKDIKDPSANNLYLLSLEGWRHQRNQLSITNSPHKFNEDLDCRAESPFSIKLREVLLKIRAERSSNITDESHKRRVTFCKHLDATQDRNLASFFKDTRLDPQLVVKKDRPSGKDKSTQLLFIPREGEGSTIIGMNRNFTSLKRRKYLEDEQCKASVQDVDKFMVPVLPDKVTRHVKIDVQIKCLNDLLELAEANPLAPDIAYNINMKAIHAIREPVCRLNKMVGMARLKASILDQIIYFIQDFHTAFNSNDFMHTVICGPPGTGKTEVAKIMGHIFSALTGLNNPKLKKVTRADLVAGYLGQTAIKTRSVIKDCIGGVLFIDEAYSLGNCEKRDSFAKECIDTLCEALSAHKHELMVIVAGYQKNLDECFFGYNAGLNSRFPWRFRTDDYSADELYSILDLKVREIGWRLSTTIDRKWFNSRMKDFEAFGRDVETLLGKVKIAHARRVFCRAEKEKKLITTADLEVGYRTFLENAKSRRDKRETVLAASSMYL